MIDIKKRIIKQLHVELSSLCNVTCSECPRNLPLHHSDEILNKVLTLDQFKDLVTPGMIKKLNHVYFCGNYGDPLLNKDLVEIINYLRTHSPSIRLGIHTNGSVRNKSWWSQLPSVLGENHVVVFSVDGLRDTNHIYRQGAVWDKIEENMRAFSENGGKAQWHYIVFEHNKHQLEKAKQLSDELGISFIEKYSNRVNIGTVVNVPKPREVSQPVPDKSTSNEDKEIRCKSIQNRELYLGADGRFYPCCHIGSYRSLRRPDAVDYTDNERVLNLVNTKDSVFCLPNCGAKGRSRVEDQFKDSK